MLLCAFCDREAKAECLWCDGQICAFHSHALYMGDETHAATIEICHACLELWKMFAWLARSEGDAEVEEALSRGLEAAGEI